LSVEGGGKVAVRLPTASDASRRWTTACAPEGPHHPLRSLDVGVLLEELAQVPLTASEIRERSGGGLGDQGSQVQRKRLTTSIHLHIK
jgi:hypothetical protein